MAQDQIEVMAGLGFERFVLLGHDRGARVGHRMALDAPGKVTKLGIWRDYARDVRGRALCCRHFLVEERPEETTTELLAFLRS
jgi:pimeloyl-ACP methyl ester carboxylesterase